MSGTKQSSNQVLDLAENIAALWHRGHILAPWFPSGLIFVGQPNMIGRQKKKSMVVSAGTNES